MRRQEVSVSLAFHWWTRWSRLSRVQGLIFNLEANRVWDRSWLAPLQLKVHLVLCWSHWNDANERKYSIYIYTELYWIMLKCFQSGGFWWFWSSEAKSVLRVQRLRHWRLWHCWRRWAIAPAIVGPFMRCRVVQGLAVKFQGAEMGWDDSEMTWDLRINF